MRALIGINMVAMATNNVGGIGTPHKDRMLTILVGSQHNVLVNAIIPIFFVNEDITLSCVHVLPTALTLLLINLV